MLPLYKGMCSQACFDTKDVNDMGAIKSYAIKSNLNIL